MMMMISIDNILCTPIRYSRSVFLYWGRKNFDIRALVILMTTRPQHAVVRTSPLTLVGAVVVVVVALLQTQRHDYTGCYTGAATFISMLRLQGSSSHGYVAKKRRPSVIGFLQQ
jgi:hypothetical protein